MNDELAAPRARRRREQLGVFCRRVLFDGSPMMFQSFHFAYEWHLDRDPREARACSFPAAREDLEECEGCLGQRIADDDPDWIHLTEDGWFCTGCCEAAGELGDDTDDEDP